MNPLSSQDGIHYIGKQKLATFLSCEDDSQITGLGGARAGSHVFQRLVSGQTEVSEWIMRPGSGGLPQKAGLLRFAVCRPATGRADD